MITRRVRASLNRIVPACLLGGALLGLTACFGGNDQHSAVQADITPELMSANQRPVDVSDMTVSTWNTNNRFFWNDLARGAYTDRPSRLEPFPVPR